MIYCIQKEIFLFCLFLLLNMKIKAQNFVNIPDFNFSNWVLTNVPHKTNTDYITFAEAASYSGKMDLSGLQIFDLTGLEAFSNLTYLDCFGFGIDSLDLTSLKKLTYLHASANSLNIHGLTALQTLLVGGGPLSSLDVTTNVSLKILDCRNISLSSLDLSKNAKLTDLYCSGVYGLSSLDLSKNKVLSFFDVSGGFLTSLNIQNGNYRNMTFIATNNPTLSCITVDNITYAISNWAGFVDNTDYFSTNCALYVKFFDTSFKKWVLSNISHPSCKGQITFNEAAAYTGKIIVDSLNINDLSGIEYFSNIDSLSCNYNNLSFLKLGQLQKLVYLSCTDNLNLQTFDVSKCSSLNYLDISRIINKDSLNFSANTKLTHLICSDINGVGTNLSSLIISDNIALTYLDCSYNENLHDLDVSNNTALAYLNCKNSPLFSLDATGATALSYLDCSFDSTFLSWSSSKHGYLSFLDVSKNNALKYLNCSSNALTNLDVTQNSKLSQLYCSNNKLASLNLQNGNNANLEVFNATSNPFLACITVDNVAYSNSNWGNFIDSHASFSNDCSLYVYFPDSLFRKWILSNVPHSSNKYQIAFPEAAAFRGKIDVNSLGISDLTGIEAFINLDSLNCSNNKLSSFDFSNNQVLTYLNCSNNNQRWYGLDTFSLPKNRSLKYLNCSNLWFFNMDFSKNINLTHLDCSSNFVGNNLDLSTNQSLAYLDCSNNQYLKKVNIDNNLSLSYLNCSGSPLNSLNISKNIRLQTLNISYTGIRQCDFSNNTLLSYINCAGNEIKKVDITKNINLSQFVCNNIYLDTLNLKNGNNGKLKIDVTKCPNLLCAEVDNIDSANSLASKGTWLKDNQLNFSINCSVIWPINFLLIKTSSEGNDSIEIRWTTGNEVNTASFSIESSNNGATFTNIGAINSIGNGANGYSYTDKHPYKGINYYRLVCVNKDGSKVYSKIVSAEFLSNSQISIYPNPVRNSLTIKGIHISMVQVVDNMGKVVKVISLKDATNPSISVEGMAKGICHLRIQTTDEKVNTVGFVKQ